MSYPAVHLIITALLLFSASQASIAQPVHHGQDLPKFMGREVAIHQPQHDAEGFPKGPATICVEGPPREQCYTAPMDFGNDPTLEVVQLAKENPALLFSASSGGVSGWEIHFALLVPGSGKELQDLLLSEVSVSSLSQDEFWIEPTISDARIFLTADAVWGPDEVHFGDHRYMISVYLRALDDPNYWLGDRYMTTRKYDLGTKVNVLQAERPEILARLKRVVPAPQPRLTPPRAIR